MLSESYELLVVIPACNEEGRIAPTIRDYCTVLGKHALILVVANGCTDQTVAVVRAMQSHLPNLRLIDIPSRIGKGGAIRVGFFASREAFTGFTDADGSTSAEEFSRLWMHCKTENLDAAIGSRWSKESIVEPAQPLARRFASRVFNMVVRLLFGMNFRDTQCGAKVFRRDSVVNALDHLELSNFAFDVDLLFQLRRLGFSRVKEVPIKWRDFSEGSQIQLASASKSMLSAVLRLRMKHSPIGHVPFFEFFAHRTVIPVRSRLSALLLVDEVIAVDEELAKFVSEWQSWNYEIKVISTGTRSILGRLSILLWYVFASRRLYDIVIEVRGPLPFLIPAFSVKPTMLVEMSHLLPTTLSKALIGKFYKRARRTSALSAREVLQYIRGSNIYAASFDRSDGDWSLNFTNMRSGTQERQRL